MYNTNRSTIKAAVKNGVKNIQAAAYNGVCTVPSYLLSQTFWLVVTIIWRCQRFDFVSSFALNFANLTSQVVELGNKY